MRSSPDAPEAVDRLVDTLHALAHSVNDQLQAEGDRRRLYVPVCGPGCDHCCHSDVLVSPPELLRIARHLRATRTESELAALRARLAEVAERTRTTSQEDWRRAKIPCPLLDGATSCCTIYEVRPGACRACNSLSLPKCLELYESGSDDVAVPANGVQQTSILAVGIGLAAACRLHGLEWESVSLTHGLAAILDRDDAAERWLAGERMFEAAHTRMSRSAAPNRKADVDATVRAVQAAHADELPAPRAPSREEQRRLRNRKKKMRQER
jgi:Fe-S-cluster containining protein